jgi:hypothetical protein
MPIVNEPKVDFHDGDNQLVKGAEHGSLSGLFGHLKVSVIATLALAIIVSGVYPAVVWGLAQVLFHDKANGSLIGKDGKPVSRPRGRDRFIADRTNLFGR